MLRIERNMDSQVLCCVLLQSKAVVYSLNNVMSDTEQNVKLKSEPRKHAKKSFTRSTESQTCLSRKVTSPRNICRNIVYNVYTGLLHTD